jgi:hypothetical protein
MTRQKTRLAVVGYGFGRQLAIGMQGTHLLGYEASS